MTAEEGDEFIRCLFAIAEGFVDRAFSRDPVQLALDRQSGKRASASPDMIDLKEVADGVFADAPHAFSEREET